MIASPLLTWIVKVPGTAWGVGTQESVAVTVTVKVPETLGVPPMAPVVEIVMPVGSPLAPHVTGTMPPDDVSWNAYTEPCVAGGSVVAEVIVSAGQLVVIENALEAVAATESVTWIVGVTVPALEDEPLSKPDAFSVMPVGSEPDVLAHE